MSAGQHQTQRYDRSQLPFESEGLASQILEFVTSKLKASIRRESNSWLKQELMEVIQRDEMPPRIEPSAFQITQPRLEKLQVRIMNSLRYLGMEDREERITEAYGNTFQWIFENQSHKQVKWSNFKGFLRSSAPLYWITGKAGSGKSTLIKYICHIRRWIEFFHRAAATKVSRVSPRLGAELPASNSDFLLLELRNAPANEARGSVPNTACSNTWPNPGLDLMRYA